QNTNLNGLIGYRIRKDLELKTSIGYTGTFSEFDRKEPISSMDPGGSRAATYTGSYTWGRDKRISWLAEPQLAYKLRLDQQQIDLLVGSTFQEDERTTFRL